MTRLLVICEGQTEAEFVRSCLEPHLRDHGLAVHSSLLKTRPGKQGGGSVSVERVAQHIRFEYHHFDCITTLLDLYGFGRAGGRDKDALEAAILDATARQIPDLRADRVVPHVQRYEFEALLFSDVDAFEWVQNGWSDQTQAKLQSIRDQYATPEDINDSPQTAPSKRIMSVFSGGQYGKVAHGPLIAEAIGVPRIRAECPGFDAWVTRLEQWGGR